MGGEEAQEVTIHALLVEARVSAHPYPPCPMHDVVGDGEEVVREEDRVVDLSSPMTNQRTPGRLRRKVSEMTVDV